jgi:hypothetical protein
MFAGGLFRKKKMEPVTTTQAMQAEDIDVVSPCAILSSIHFISIQNLSNSTVNA